jgi:hypothetical protein
MDTPVSLVGASLEHSRTFEPIYQARERRAVDHLNSSDPCNTQKSRGEKQCARKDEYRELRLGNFHS